MQPSADYLQTAAVLCELENVAGQIHKAVHIGSGGLTSACGCGVLDSVVVVGIGEWGRVCGLGQRVCALGSSKELRPAT